MEYKAYSITAFEEQPGRWFAKIQRLEQQTYQAREKSY
jgi:hypothetical protein